MEKTAITTVLLIMTVFSTASIRAQEIFYDNFEGVEAATLPQPGSDYDPNAVIGTWMLGEDPNDGIQVINNVIPGPYNSGGQYLIMERTSAATDAGGGVHSTAVFSESPGSNLIATFAFNNDNGEHWIYIYNGMEDTDPVVVLLKLQPTGQIVNMYFGSEEPTELTHSIGEWNQMRLVLSFSTKTYDLYINGQVKTGLHFSTPIGDVGSAHRLKFYNYPSVMPSRLYLDDIVVETGTPECQSLLAADLNGDCQTDLVDFARFAGRWLECYLEPSEACNW